MATDITLEQVRRILGEALGIPERAAGYASDTALLGAIPEFDSMAVVTVLTMVEEHFDVEISDDEVDAETFATLGALADFVEAKIAA